MNAALVATPVWIGSVLYCAILCMHILQTLLKTTNHILIHDVRGSLAHLRSLVQRGVSPSVNMCVICSRPPSTLADGSKDDVMVFT